MQATRSQYVLGHAEEELLRLDRQAAALSTVTHALLREAGIRDGMTVLDLGTGTGRVATVLAELVGPRGRIVALDRSTAALDHARRQAGAAGVPTIEFLEADVAAPLSVRGADAAVCRLVLAFQADPLAVLRNWVATLHPGGLVVALEYDFTGARSLPEVGLAQQALRWIDEAFAVADQRQSLGPRLAGLFTRAGLCDVGTLGGQLYFAPGDPAGPAMISGVVRTLLPVIVGADIATEEEVDPNTLQQRLIHALQDRDAVLCPPTLVACWGRVP